MRKFVAALAVLAACALGWSGLANAYPPAAPAVTVGAASGGPGFLVTVTAACVPGESVDFVLVDSSATETCVAVDGQDTPSEVGFRALAATLAAGAPDDAGATGTVTGQVTAPTEPGTYTGTVTGSESGLIGTFSISVTGSTAADPSGSTGGALPSTGSDGTSTLLGIAAGLLVVGMGIFAVTTIRRRQQPAGV